MKGTIARIIFDKGFGFIRGEDRLERFFHKSECITDFNELKEGAQVNFDEEKSPKGPRATNIEEA